MLRRCAPVALAAALLLAIGGPAAAKTASGTKCKLSVKQEEHLGPTYVNPVTVSGGATCATAVKLVKAYYKCRVRSGGVKGTCHTAVLGYHCTEKRTAIPTQIDAKVTCTSGKKRVIHSYQQNT